MTAYNRIHKLGIDNWQIYQIRTSTQWYYQCIVLDSRRLAQVQFLKSNYTDYSGNLVKQFQFWRVVVSLLSFYFQESLLQQHHCPNLLYLAKLVLPTFSYWSDCGILRHCLIWVRQQHRGDHIWDSYVLLDQTELNHLEGTSDPHLHLRVWWTSWRICFLFLLQRWPMHHLRQMIAGFEEESEFGFQNIPGWRRCWELGLIDHPGRLLSRCIGICSFHNHLESLREVCS